MTIKRKLGKISALLLTAALLLTLAACGNASSENKTSSQTKQSSQAASSAAEADASKSDTPSDTPQDSGKALVVYFSATGTTKGVAAQIASAAGADTYEILAAQPYTSDDLNWNDSNSRTTKEQNDKTVRPEIGGEDISLDGYSTVFIGYPIWWGEEPRIMDTFVEAHDFSGKTVVPFCTSSSSPIGSSGDNLAANAGSGNWLEGERLSSSSDIEGWLSSLGYYTNLH